MIDAKHYMDISQNELGRIMHNHPKHMPINENGVNWGITQVKVALNIHHL
jgi:hypothetical protein